MTQPLLLALVFGGGVVYWVGLIARSRPIVAGGSLALLLALALMVSQGAVSPWSVPWLIGAGVWLALPRHGLPSAWLRAGWILYGLIVVILGARLIPFTAPVPLLEIAAPSPPAVVRFQPDRLFLLLLVPALALPPLKPRLAFGTRRPWSTTVVIAAISLMILVPLAWLTGSTAPGSSPRSAPHLLYWLIHNLLFISLVEEYLFRGLAQTAIIRACRRYRAASWADWLGIALASLLFGLAHLRAGSVFVLLATLAGLGYGATYYLTGRVHAAVGVHFMVNAVYKSMFSP